MNWELTYEFDPPNPKIKEGVTKGYIVWRDDGEAWIADAVILADEDGSGVIMQTGEMCETKIVE